MTGGSRAVGRLLPVRLFTPAGSGSGAGTRVGRGARKGEELVAGGVAVGGVGVVEVVDVEDQQRARMLMLGGVVNDSLDPELQAVIRAVCGSRLEAFCSASSVCLRSVMSSTTIPIPITSPSRRTG